MTRMIDDLKEMVHEQVEYRDLFWQMTKRDLLLRYKQTIMGFGWAVFMPVVNTLIFSVVFTRVARIDVGVPYPLFAFIGLLAWNFFASSLKFAATSLSSNASLVSKVYFPREVFPVSQVIVCLVDAAIASTVVVALMAWYGVVPGRHVLWLPLVLVVHVTLTAAAALLLSMCNLFFRDVKYLTDIVLSVAMFSTSALYPAALAGGTAGRLIALNPLTIIIDAYRDALLFGRSPINESFVTLAAWSVVVLMASWLIFHRAEYRFAESV